MALTTFSELKSAIASWLARDDLTTNIPDFITEFEAVANRRLRVRQMEASTTLTTTSGSTTLPTDYLDWRSVTWAGSTTSQLEYASPQNLRGWFPDSSQGQPVWFTIEGTTFTTRPIDDTTNITFRYYQKIPSLSDSATTNWLLTAHPDLYLSGSLHEAATFVQDANAALLWKAKRDDLFEEIMRLSYASRGGGAARPQTWIV